VGIPNKKQLILKWCDDNRQQIETMGGSYRAIGADFIHAKNKS
jgi:hypothetical protein